MRIKYPEIYFGYVDESARRWLNGRFGMCG